MAANIPVHLQPDTISEFFAKFSFTLINASSPSFYQLAVASSKHFCTAQFWSG